MTGFEADDALRIQPRAWAPSDLSRAGGHRRAREEVHLPCRSRKGIHTPGLAAPQPARSRPNTARAEAELAMNSGFSGYAASEAAAFSRAPWTRRRMLRSAPMKSGIQKRSPTAVAIIPPMGICPMRNAAVMQIAAVSLAIQP